MPGAVGRTSTFALCNVTLPWVRLLANKGIDSAIAGSKPLQHALNVYGGRITNQAVAETFSFEFVPFAA